MNDERNDDKRPPRAASARRAGEGAPGLSRKRPDTAPPARKPGDRPKYVAPPRVVYAPAKLLGIASHVSPEASKDSARLVSMLLDVVEEAAPLPAGRHKDLRRDVLELWRELTSEKSTRQPDYIGEPAKLAAYLRYFLPWNVVRLAPVLAGLDLGLSAGSAVLDIGSGPLTLPIALWIARPELRGLSLRIECMDRVRRVMEIGATVLEGLALRAGQPFAWKVGIKKDSFSIVDEAGGERYDLVTAANVFNESFWRVKGSLSERADMLAESLGSYAVPGGRVLVVEPGDPRSGAMLAALRESVILGGGRPLAPCPHTAACPMAGAFLSSAFRKEEGAEEARHGRRDGASAIAPVVTARGRSKAPWCHFVIEPGAAPQRLVDFSETAGLPKDRLIASWLLLQPEPPAGAAAPCPPDRSVRIVSDAFRLPDGGAGRYACTRTGYALVRESLADLPSGSLAVLDAPLPPTASERDPKSNAVIIKARAADIAHVPLPFKAPRGEAASGEPAATRAPRGGDGRQAPDGARRSGDHRPSDSRKTGVGSGADGRGGAKRPDRERKPPIPRRGDGAERAKPGLAERSPYARSKKPWGPKRPKRST